MSDSYNILRVVDDGEFFKVYFEVWHDGMNNGETMWMTSSGDYESQMGLIIQEFVDNGGEITSG